VGAGGFQQRPGVQDERRLMLQWQARRHGDYI
jgi:hypothetical protein